MTPEEREASETENEGETSFDSGPVTVEPETGQVFMTPYGFHRDAGDFLKASRVLQPYKSGRIPSVKYFLLYKSIELSLKAFLLSRKVSLKLLADSKKYGHKIGNLLDLAIAKELKSVVALSDEHLAELRKGAQYYLDRNFDYFKFISVIHGSPGDPDVRLIDDMAEALLRRSRTNRSRGPSRLAGRQGSGPCDQSRDRLVSKLFRLRYTTTIVALSAWV